jgi:hypothetical protein
MKAQPRKGEWMQTRAGLAYWPADPRPEEVLIDDIAHALAMLCRYGGHCRRFYSVAEHSICVSRLVPPEHALVGLLHDATEAYLVDLPRPVKRMLPAYRELEDANWKAIATKFCLPVSMSDCVKRADFDMCLAEQKALMTPAPAPWGIQGEVPNITIECWPPAVAASRFLERFYEVYKH